MESVMKHIICIIMLFAIFSKMSHVEAFIQDIDIDVSTPLSAYKFEDKFAGHLKLAEVWTSNDTLQDVKGNTVPMAAAYVNVYYKCTPWMEFVDTDRLLVYYEGSAMIHMISNEGELVSKCLGTQSDGETCSGIVVVPKGWKSVVLFDETSPLIHYVVIFRSRSVPNDRSFSYEEMIGSFRNHEELIKTTGRCYNMPSMYMR